MILLILLSFLVSFGLFYTINRQIKNLNKLVQEQTTKTDNLKSDIKALRVGLLENNSSSGTLFTRLYGKLFN